MSSKLEKKGHEKSKSETAQKLQTMNSNVNYNFNVNSIQINNQDGTSKKLNSNMVLDNRKFSIIDIPGVNFIQEQIQGTNCANNNQISGPYANNNIKQNTRLFGFGEYHMSSSSKEASMLKLSTKLKMNLSSLKTKSLKCLYLMLESDFLTPQKRLKISITVKPIYNISKSLLLKNFIKGLMRQISHIDLKYKNIPNLKDELRGWQPKFSITTQFALNHLTRNSESIFSTLRLQHEEVDLLFKAIFILFNVNEQSNFENTMISLYSQFKVDSLSKNPK